MMKSVAPIWSKLRHLRTPALFKVSSHKGTETDQPTVGQRIAEKVAAGVGSWMFLIIQSIQSGFLARWVLANGLRILGYGSHASRLRARPRLL